MANTRCLYKVQWVIFVNLAGIFCMSAAALNISGGIIFHNEHYSQTIHERNTCEVTASSYYETRCAAARGGSFVCFRPVWIVTFSIVENSNEVRMNARIEQDGSRRIETAQDRLHQYQIGKSYLCWCNVIDPSKAQWDEPTTFVGMMLLIFGGVATILFLIAIYLSYRARKNMQAGK